MPKDDLEHLGAVSPLEDDLNMRGALLSYAAVRPSVLPELFHYTSPDGLRGIVDDRAMWLTNAAYVNDEQELTYPATVARVVVTALIQHEADERRRQFLTAVASLLESHTLYRTWYIASFTTHGNALSQWRAYCAGGGYCIGFDGPALVRGMPRASSYLYGQIIYDAGEQANRVNSVIQRYLQEWAELREKHSTIPDAEYDAAVASALNFWLSRELIFFKSTAFSSECEWRLAQNPLRSASLQFRTRAGLLTPFLSAPLVQEGAKLPITRLVIGPLGDVGLAFHAGRSLLLNRDYEGTAIEAPNYHLRY